MDKATLEAAARVCSEMSYTAKYHFDPDGAWCAGANAATNNCVIAILALADQAPVAPVEASGRKLVYNKTTKKIDVVDRHGLVHDSFAPPLECDAALPAEAKPTLICDICGADRFKEPCKQPHRIMDCTIIGTPFHAAAKWPPLR